MTPAESRYSPAEGELLAVADSLYKARHYPRILALKEKTLWFQFEVVHVPGGMHCGPDYMSRHCQEEGTVTLKEVRLRCTMWLVSGWVGDIRQHRGGPAAGHNCCTRTQ